jgi:hypothetical protein
MKVTLWGTRGSIPSPGPETNRYGGNTSCVEIRGPNDTLLIIVRLANKACNKLGIGLSKDPSIILAATPEASLLGLSEVFLAELEIILEDSMILQGDSNLNIP